MQIHQAVNNPESEIYVAAVRQKEDEQRKRQEAERKEKEERRKREEGEEREKEERRKREEAEEELKAQLAATHASK